MPFHIWLSFILKYKCHDVPVMCSVPLQSFRCAILWNLYITTKYSLAETLTYIHPQWLLSSYVGTMILMSNLEQQCVDNSMIYIVEFIELKQRKCLASPKNKMFQVNISANHRYIHICLYYRHENHWTTDHFVTILRRVCGHKKGVHGRELRASQP